MSCTQESGQCACKDNVEGRTCDHCTYGSYQYPDCQTCDCDISGTTERICDQVTFPFLPLTEKIRIKKF